MRMNLSHAWWCASLTLDTYLLYPERNSISSIEACYGNYSLQFLMWYVYVLCVYDKVTKHHADIRLIGFEWISSCCCVHVCVYVIIIIILHMKLKLSCISRLLCNLIIFFFRTNDVESQSKTYVGNYDETHVYYAKNSWFVEHTRITCEKLLRNYTVMVDSLQKKVG